ncbi:uncharacterized protein [Amphiura filiformis]|uniref:uncharacterized protein isoform X1 n=1 Tax=Amphiura filiformis TaxID=82378 RepID=UPI003B224A36
MTTNNNNSIGGVGSGAVLESKDNDNDKDNPFAEYMWMNEEDEFNKQALEQIREEDFIERCFEEMLEEEEMGMFLPPADQLLHLQQQDVDAGVELMNNLNLGGGGIVGQGNIVAPQEIEEEELSSSEHGDEEDAAANEDVGQSNQDHGGSNHGNDEAEEDNSQGSISDVDSDSSSDAPLR